MSDEEGSKLWAEVQKARDDELVARWQHFYSLALRMISHDGQDSYSSADVQHFAEMLLLLDIARGNASGIGYTRFRARYAGNYGGGEEKP